MAKHAKLSPSSAERWINCAGSVALVGDESSAAGMPAMMGTAAHKVVETMIAQRETDAREYLGCIVLVHGPGTEDSIIYTSDDPEAMKRRPDWFAFPVNEDMVNGVQTMIDEVERVVADLFHPEIYTERFLDMSWLDPRLGGTADVSAVEPFGWVHLFDYKNGYVVVEVKDNPQMKNYGVGLLHEHPDAEGVVVHLVQPNAPHEEGVIRSETYTRDELKLFEIQLKEAADATSVPNAPLRAGSWCTWCPAKIRCPEFEAAMEREAVMEFSDDPPEPALALPVPVDNTELARKAAWIPVFDQWGRDIEGAIQHALEHGETVPGKKLVLKKANRRWLQDAKVVEDKIVDGADIAASELYTDPKLKSPAKIEKLGDKAQRKIIKKLVGELSGKPNTGYTVANENDPREAVDAVSLAAMEFMDEDDSDPAE